MQADRRFRKSHHISSDLLIHFEPPAARCCSPPSRIHSSHGASTQASTSHRDWSKSSLLCSLSPSRQYRSRLLDGFLHPPLASFRHLPHIDLLDSTQHSSVRVSSSHIFREFHWLVTVLHIFHPFGQRHRSPIRSFNPSIQKRTFATAAFPRSFSPSSVFNSIRSRFAMYASPPSPMTRVLWLETPSFGVHSMKQKFSPAPSDSIVSVVRFLRPVLVHESFQLIQAFHGFGFLRLSGCLIQTFHWILWLLFLRLLSLFL